MSAVVGRRAACCTGSTSTRRRSTVSIPATGENRRDADARVDRLLRAARRAAASSSRCATASGSPSASGKLERSVAAPPYDPAHHRFNDGRCDPQGRFVVGSMNENRDADGAALYRLDADFTLTRLFGDMTISNGLAWSPDGTHDVPRRYARAHRSARTTTTPVAGLPAQRPRRSRSWPGETERPDGGAVDSAGNYWAAFYRGGKVVQAVAAAAQLVAEYPVPGDVPDDVRVRRRRPAHALRHDGAAEARRRRARALAAKRRHFLDARRRCPACPKRAFAADVIDARCSSIPPHYLRLDVPHSLGATAAGASFATSSGDILDVECFGEGIVPAARRPEHAPRLRHRRRRARRTAPSRSGCRACGRSPRATRCSRSAARRCASGCRGKSAPVLRSITDEHVRGWTRLPTFGRLRQGGLWTAAFALASGEPVYGLGEKFGPLNKRGQLIHSQVEDALGVNTGLAYKNTPFAWSPGTGKGAWGAFIHTPGMVTHGVGHPGLVAPQLRGDGRGRGARPLPVRRRHARRRSSIATRS